MSIEKNTDICVLVGVNDEGDQVTVFSPLEQKNIVVNINKDILEDVSMDEAVAFEVDLDNRTIVE